MSAWLINGNTPEALGLRVVGGEFRTGGASTVVLERICQFDDTESLAYGDAVEITRDGSAFFKGKCRAIPKSATGGSEEGHDYLIEDAWSDMERTVYQELWGSYSGTFLSPNVILGMNQSGVKIGVGTQIAEAIDFAVSSSIDIQAGSIPAGMMLWPSVASGLSIAEVIRTSLRYYPDWIAWIDHTTTPPTFNVTPRASATARTLAVTDCSDFTVTKTSDRVPECVRILFLTAHLVGEDVFRDGVMQKYPVDGPESGPGVLTTVIELAGMNVQIEKQQVYTRTIPTTEDILTTARPWLKLHFPEIADIDITHFGLTHWNLKLLANDVAVTPIDDKLPRKPATSLSHVPRELVKGNIAEWMQKYYGMVMVEFGVRPTALATAAEKKLLAKLPPYKTVAATNAVTKIYRGVSSFVAGDQAPAGIAQAYYETLVAGCYFEGRATLIEQDVGATRWHGSKLHLSGGVSEWATMGAPIHSVAWDIASQKVELSFGPNPDYSVQDFLEYLRLLNKRQHTDITPAERTGNTLGSEFKNSHKGDSVNPIDGPETVTGTLEVFTPPFELQVISDGEDWKWKVSSDRSTVTDGTNGELVDLTGAGFDGDGTAFSSDTYIVLEADVADETLVTSGWTLSAVTAATAAKEVGLTSSGTVRQDKIRLFIGVARMVGSPAVGQESQAVFTAQRIAWGIMNGLAVKVFESAPVHPDDL